MHDHKVFFGHNRPGFIFQRWRDALNEIEQTLTTGSNVRAVSDVVRRPKLLGSLLDTLVEQRIERVQDEGLVLFGCSFRHLHFSLSLGVLTEVIVTASTRHRREYWHR